MIVNVLRALAISAGVVLVALAAWAALVLPLLYWITKDRTGENPAGTK